MPHSRRSRARIVDEPALLDPAGDARGERRLDHRREQRQDVDLERHGFRTDAGGVASAPGSAGGPSVPGSAASAGERAFRRGGRASAAAPSAGRRRRARFGGVRSSASTSTTISPRRGANTRTNAADRGHVELAVRPAVDEEDLGAARAVDVADRPELGAVDAANGRADDLVPEVLAARQLRLGPGDASRYAPRSSSAASRVVTSAKCRRQPGPSATADDQSMVSGSSLPSR